MCFDELCDDIRNNKGVVFCKFLDRNVVIFDTFFVCVFCKRIDEVAFFLKHESGGCEFVYNVDIELLTHCGQYSVSDTYSRVVVTLIVRVIPILSPVVFAGLLGGFFGDGFEHGPENSSLIVCGNDFHASECCRT